MLWRHLSSANSYRDGWSADHGSHSNCVARFCSGTHETLSAQQFQPGMWRPASVAPGFDARAEARQLDPSISGRLLPASWLLGLATLRLWRRAELCRLAMRSAEPPRRSWEAWSSFGSGSQNPRRRDPGFAHSEAPKPFHCKALRQPEQEDTECLRACLVLLRTLGRERRAA